MNQKRTVGILTIIVLAIAYRFLPHPYNFSPINAVFLFAGAMFLRNWKLLLTVFGIVLLSDFILNNTLMRSFFESEGIIWFAPFMAFNYIAFALIIGIGTLIKKVKIVPIVVGSIAASTLFFLLTNAGAWAFDPFHFYANGASGLTAAIIAGLPFAHWTYISDLFFSGVLFGAYYVINEYGIIPKPAQS